MFVVAVAAAVVAQGLLSTELAIVIGMRALFHPLTQRGCRESSREMGERLCLVHFRMLGMLCVMRGAGEVGKVGDFGGLVFGGGGTELN